MKNDLKFSQSKFSRFLSGKGFYIALAVCLVGAGSAAWVAVDKTMGAVDLGQNSSISSSSTTQQGGDMQWNYPDSDSVVNNESQVPISSGSSTHSSSSSTSSSSQQQSGKSVGASAGQVQQQGEQKLLYVLPVQGEIFNKYSDGELVKNETLGEWRTHDGIDIKAAVGDGVMACANGTVKEVYEDPMWGTCVCIQHEGDVLSYYMGLEKEVSVKEGDTVKGSDVIGKVGQTNLAEQSSEPHLHFAMKQAGEYANPLEVMDKLK